MESRKNDTTGRPSSVKQPYEPPRATFVPLKLEERLLLCGKFSTTGDIRCTFLQAS